jgi:hypothetical protein
VRGDLGKAVQQLKRDSGKPLDLKLVSRMELAPGVVAMRYEPRR